MFNKVVNLTKALIDNNHDFIKDRYYNWKYRKEIEIKRYLGLSEYIFKHADVCCVLSTGRCGTELLTKILSKFPNVDAYHGPFPSLDLPSKIIYERRLDKNSVELAIITARYELIKKSFLRKKKYVETNNKLTFFAPSLANLFVKSKFIHLVRHPANFVRSAIRRRYYIGEHSGDESRIRPINNNVEWKKMTEIEKNAWLWNETNQLIEDFKKSLNAPNRILTLKCEDLFNDYRVIDKLSFFLEEENIDASKFKKIISIQVNVQTEGEFPKYSNWNLTQKEQLKRYALLAKRYEYEL